MIESSSAPTLRRAGTHTHTYVSLWASPRACTCTHLQGCHRHRHRQCTRPARALDCRLRARGTTPREQCRDVSRGSAGPWLAARVRNGCAGAESAGAGAGAGGGGRSTRDVSMSIQRVRSRGRNLHQSVQSRAGAEWSTRVCSYGLKSINWNTQPCLGLAVQRFVRHWPAGTVRAQKGR